MSKNGPKVNKRAKNSKNEAHHSVHGRDSVIDHGEAPIVDENDRDHCCCCHCGSGQEDARNQSYLRMREHLQTRLKEKHNHGSVSSQDSSSSGKYSNGSTLNGTEAIDDLVEYINGSNKNKQPQPNPKKAAKKARQKQRKLEEKLAAEAEAARLEAEAARLKAEAAKKPKAAKKVPEVKEQNDRVPNGMVRITHNPLTNSAVITPLYGPLEPSTTSYLQQSLPHTLPARAPPVAFPTAEPPKPAPAPASLTSTAPGQQMVTIRRVMQPGNMSEPVVTVTLKGQTPDGRDDRVLFTLVNGQVLPTSDGDKVSAPANSSSTPKAPSNVTPTQSASSKKKQRKKEKKLLKQQMQQEVTNGLHSTNSSQPAQPYPAAYKQEVPSYRPANTTPTEPSRDYVEKSGLNDDFSLDNFRLPPGITLTRVQQGTYPPTTHPQLPMKLANANSQSVSNGSRSQSTNPIIVTSPLHNRGPGVPAPPTKSKEAGPSLSAPNVIVVDTRKIPSNPPVTNSRNVQMQSVAVQTGEDDDDPPKPTKKQLKRQRRKERKQLEQQMADLQIVQPRPPTKTTSSKKETANSFHDTKKKSKSKSKSKKKSSTGGISAGHSHVSEDKWEENIFAPKSDLDLERGDMDDDERELEAFKRFCFNTVPPERKEKVRIQLNVKDIFGKSAKTSSSSSSSSCKST